MTVLVSDSFNRADSTTTAGTTDSYNGGSPKTWTVYGGGTWGISSNQLYQAGGGGSGDSAFLAVNVGQSDVSYTITMATKGASPIFVLRGVSATSYLMLQAKSGGYYLYQYTGSYTSLGNSTTAPANGDIINVVLQGSSITVKVNGVQKLTATSNFNQTATLFGVYSENSSLPRFDNFEVDDLNTGSTSVPLISTVKSTSNAMAIPSLTGNMNVPLSSTVKSSSSVTSTIKKTVAMISSVKSNTSATATVKSSVALGSTVKSNTAGTFKLANSQVLVSTVKSNTSATGTLKGNQALSSTVKSNSGTTNTLADAVSLGTSNKSNTSSSAHITLTSQGGIASTVKSSTSSTANVSVIRPLSSTVKSSTTSSGYVKNNKSIISTSKSSSSESAILGKVIQIFSTTKSVSSSSAHLNTGTTFISSKTISNTKSTSSANISLSLISNTKSHSLSNASIVSFTWVSSSTKSNSHSSGSLIYLGIASYQEIVEFVMKINPQVNFTFTINPVNEFKVKI